MRAWLAGLNEPGFGPALELSHDHIEIGNIPEFVIQGPYRGHDGVKKWFEDAFETLVTTQVVSGTSTHTDLPFELRWAAVWKVTDCKVERIQGYATKGQAMRAAQG